MRLNGTRWTVLVMLVAAPSAAQERSLVARFSATQWREPTFVVSRASYIALFEMVSATQVRQLYPRGMAAAATRLPAGETPLAMLDVSIGRIVEAPGVRTVFWQGGDFGQRHVPASEAIDARSFLLVASTEPLVVGMPSEFAGAFAVALSRVDSALPAQVRAVQAVVAAVHPASKTAEVASELETMWLAANPSLRGAATSIGANDADGAAIGCEAIYPYGYAAVTTYASTRGCPDAFVPLWFDFGGWGTTGVLFIPAPMTGGERPPVVGFTPSSPTAAPHVSGRVRHVGREWPIEQRPVSTGSAFSAPANRVQNVAGGGREERVPLPAPPPTTGGGGGGGGVGRSGRPVADRAREEFVPRASAPSVPARPWGGAPATTPVREAPRRVSPASPVLSAPAAPRAASSPPARPATSRGADRSAGAAWSVRPHH